MVRSSSTMDMAGHQTIRIGQDRYGEVWVDLRTGRKERFVCVSLDKGRMPAQVGGVLPTEEIRLKREGVSSGTVAYILFAFFFMLILLVSRFVGGR